MTVSAGGPHLEAELIRILGDRTRSVPAQSIPGEARLPSEPGLYSWWADEEAQSILGRALGARVGPLVYVGQAGAGTSGTLASRILGNHITGSMRRSTFRRTVGVVLQADRAASATLHANSTPSHQPASLLRDGRSLMAQTEGSS